MGSFVEKTGHVYWIHLPEHTCTANENNRAKTTHGIYAKYINQNKVA